MLFVDGGIDGVVRLEAWHRDAADTAGPIRLPEFGIELSLDDVYSGVDFD